MISSLRFFPFALCAALAAGCASSRETLAPAKDAGTEDAARAVASVAAFASAAEAEVESAGLPENREIGIVVMSDPEARLFVAQLYAGESVAVGEELSVRRFDLTPTARVRVETAERRTVGGRVLDGNVVEGQILTTKR